MDLYLSPDDVRKVQKKRDEEQIDSAPNRFDYDPRAPIGGDHADPNAYGAGYDPGYDPGFQPRSAPIGALSRTPGPTPLDNYRTAYQGSLGFFTGDNPLDSVDRARRGLLEGEQFSTYDLGFVRNMEDGRARDAAARVGGQLVDPINLATLPFGPATRLGTAFGIGAEEVARPVARAFGADQDTEDIIGAVANIAGNFVTPNMAKGGLSHLNRLGDADAIKRAAPEASQIGRVAGTDSLFTIDGKPTGNVFDLDTGWVKRNGEDALPSKKWYSTAAGDWRARVSEMFDEGLRPKQGQMVGAADDLASVTPEAMKAAGLTEKEISVIERAQMGAPRPDDRDTLMTALSKVFKNMMDDPAEVAAREAADLGHAPAAATPQERWKQLEEVRQQYAEGRMQQAANAIQPEDTAAVNTATKRIEDYSAQSLSGSRSLKVEYGDWQHDTLTNILEESGLPPNKWPAFFKGLGDKLDQSLADMRDPSARAFRENMRDWVREAERRVTTPDIKPIGGAANLPGEPNKIPLTPKGAPPRPRAVGNDPLVGADNFSAAKQQELAAKQAAEAEAERLRITRERDAAINAGAVRSSGRSGIDAFPSGPRPPSAPEVDIPGSTRARSGGTEMGNRTPPPVGNTAITPGSDEIPSWGEIVSKMNKPRIAVIVAGAATGAATGDTPAERFRNAFVGAGIGYTGYRAAQHFLTPNLGVQPKVLNRLQSIARGNYTGRIDPEMVDTIHTFIRATAPDITTSIAADGAMTKLLLGNAMSNSDWSVLRKVMPEKDIQKLSAAYSLRGAPIPSRGQKLWTTTIDVLNVPRSLKSSWDASAPFRQGMILLMNHPLTGVKNVGMMMKALASEDAAQAIARQIENSPNAAKYKKAGLYISPLDGTMVDNEEAFMSVLAEKIPGVRASERGYVTFLNKMRTDVFDQVERNWAGTGKTDEDYEILGRFLNAVSGRGTIPKRISGASPVLNAIFFSPRFFTSRFESHAALFSKSPAVRELARRELGVFYGTNMAILSMVYAANKAGLVDWEVEPDPTAADFGMVRIGNYRYDFTAGHQQIFRMMAQMATGEKKSTNTREKNPIDYSDTIVDFFRNKLAPLPAGIVDAAVGRDRDGNDINFTPESISEQLIRATAPIIAADIYEGLKEDGYLGGFMVAPSVSGVSVGHYGGSPMDKVSPGGDFYALPNSVQEDLKNQNPDLWDATVQKGSDEFRKAETARKQYKEQQLADDAMLQDSPAYIDAWKENLSRRTIELGGYLKATYEGKPQSKARNMADEYVKRLGDWRMPNGQADWDRIEEWRATLSDEQNSYIDSEIGIGSTPAAKDYRRVGKELRAKGFYTTTREDPWREVQSFTGTKVKSFAEWKQKEVSSLMKELNSSGITGGEALTIAEQIIEQAPESDLFGELKKVAELEFAMEHPDLTSKAGLYRYTSLSKDEIAMVLAGKSQ